MDNDNSNVTAFEVPRRRSLSVEEMMAAKDIEYDEIEAFGGIVRIGSIDSGEMITFMERNEGPAKRTAGLRLIISSLVDDDGNRIGKDEHLQFWMKRSQKTCNRIVEAIMRLNGLGDSTKKRDDIVHAILALTEINKDTVTAAVDSVLKSKEAPGNV
jgi:hypothetical protein